MKTYQMYRRQLAGVEAEVREPREGGPVADVIESYTRNAVRHACAALRQGPAFDYEPGRIERTDAPFEAFAHLLFWDLFVLARKAGWLIRSAAAFKQLCDTQPHRVPALIDSLRKGRRVDVLAALLVERTTEGPGYARTSRVG